VSEIWLREKFIKLVQYFSVSQQQTQLGRSTTVLLESEPGVVENVVYRMQWCRSMKNIKGPGDDLQCLLFLPFFGGDESGSELK